MLPRDAVSYITDLVNQIVARRRQHLERRNDFIQIMIDHEEEVQHEEQAEKQEEKRRGTLSKTLNDREILAQALVFMTAGYETTSILMSFFFYVMATEPIIQEKVYDEIRQEIGDDDITQEKLGELHYLDMVINETLRMYPPFIRFNRWASVDYELGKYHIPKGTYINVPVYPIHHDPIAWPDPETFIPERFLPAEKAKRHPMSFLPFGDGPRNCIGMRFALLEAKVGIAKALRLVEIQKCEKTEVPLQLTKLVGLNSKNGDIAVSSDWNEKEKTEMKYDVSKEDTSQQLVTSNDDDHAPQLRSYVAHHNPRSPQRIGHTNIYIDKNARRGNSRHNERLRFPLAQYDRNRIPFRGPFINFMPRVPIFADRRTKQTLIFSPTGGVYIIPPLINFYGQMFSVAELIASGYASLVSSGVPPTGNFNMMPFFLPQPLIGSGIPRINPRTGGFNGGIRTKFGAFSTSKRYGTQNNVDATVETEEEENDNDSDDSNNNDNYQYQSVSGKNYKRPRNDDKKPIKNHKRPRNNYKKTTKYHERPTKNHERSTTTSTTTTFPTTGTIHAL
ncbi:unnamed protein product [Adineta steineri]|uniref:Cytochrome P450 n=1 Tax=Adineta steineri TaxID=433720 RepID=A0A819T5G5_9BILA|nr:unnamed protein product [Adineta steineri]CAF4071713.1 unnamed protein product [Adineta steineri]